jgi:hypothetical protein
MDVKCLCFTHGSLEIIRVSLEQSSGRAVNFVIIGFCLIMISGLRPLRV